MEFSDIARMPNASGAASAPRMEVIADAGPERHEQCDGCGTVVAREQRYCVACGARRRHVPDPAARFLNRASATARADESSARAARTTRRRSPTLAAALLIAVIPLAIALGVLVGRASTSGDARLIAALRAQKPEVITTAGGAATSTAAGVTAAGTSPQRHAAARKVSGAARKTAAKHGSSTNARTNASTGAQLTSSKPSQQQLDQGAAAVHKVQQATGQSYVNSQQGLPNEVSVP